MAGPEILDLIPVGRLAARLEELQYGKILHRSVQEGEVEEEEGVAVVVAAVAEEADLDPRMNQMNHLQHLCRKLGHE